MAMSTYRFVRNNRVLTPQTTKQNPKTMFASSKVSSHGNVENIMRS